MLVGGVGIPDRISQVTELQLDTGGSWCQVVDGPDDKSTSVDLELQGTMSVVRLDWRHSQTQNPIVREAEQKDSFEQ